MLLAWGFAVALVTATVLLKYVSDGPLGRDAPFLLMFGASVAATWFGGRSAGVLAAFLGTAAVTYFFLRPYAKWHLTPGGTIHAAIFGVENLLVVGLTSMLTRARRAAEAATARVRRLHAVSSALARARAPRDVGATVVREGAAALGSAHAMFFVAAEDRSRVRLVAHRGLPPELVELLGEIPVDAPFPIVAPMRTGQLVAIGRQEELRAAFPQIFAPPAPPELPHAVLCAPVRAGGPTLGVLVFGFLRDHDLSPEDCELAESLARDCAGALVRARFYEAERRAHRDAEEANRAKDDFLGVVSHELRTPLTAIAGWAHLLQRDWRNDPERVAHGLQVINRNVQAESRLIEDLLDMSRIVSRRLRVGHAPLELSSVVRAVVEELEPTAAAKGVALAVRASTVAPVVGDPERLAQVTRNLVGNALKFTAARGHIEVSVERCGKRAILRVQDDGAGIPSEELPHVFEAFRQADRSTTRRGAGLGLGLSIVRGIVEAHEGHVRIDSAGPGRGTTVTVDLPAAAAVSEQKRGPACAAAALAGVRVLVVEDEPDTLEAVCALLADAGAEVRGVASAGAALDAVGRFTPDVLVSDIAMPEHDGYWLIRELRAAGTPSAGCPALALTAHAGGDSARRALAAGYQRHLAKPPRPDVLTTTVAELARETA